MALKIVGRSPRIAVTETRKPAMVSREIAMECDLCHKKCFGVIPYDPTPQQRLQVMRDAMNEHRRVCAVGVPEQQRVYSIWYPRA